jgi:flagellar brake protein
MLAQLRKVFLNVQEDSSDGLTLELQNPSFITDPSKIASLLQQIIESPPLCSVTVPNSAKVYFTSILEIQREKKLLLFDRLTPGIDSRFSNRLDTVKVSTTINGVQLTFQLQDIVQDQSCHPPVYKARLPVSIYYPQRRSSPRIQTDPDAISFQGISRDTGILLKGNVLDISRSGLCFTLPNGGNTIVSGDKLTNCIIRLPDESTFAFDLLLRSSRKKGANNLQRQVGGYFNELSYQNQNKLDRTICALERQHIRKQKISQSIW